VPAAFFLALFLFCDAKGSKNALEVLLKCILGLNDFFEFEDDF